MNAKDPSARVEEMSLVHRRRIWELDHGRHCSVLGTCLSLNDLHAVARRAGYLIPSDTSAYELHVWFVDMMASPNELSKRVDKELEKQHARAARAVRGARTEQEIEARWKEIAARGQIAGAYWGAMSHPLCSNALQWKLFGEIHMLSHLVGASRRSDLARSHEFEVLCASLDGKLAQLKHVHRASLKERKLLDEELTTRRRRCDLAERRLTIAQRRIEELESQPLVRELQAHIEELERRLRETEERASRAESALTHNHALLEELRDAGTRAGDQLRELSAENEALERELTASMICPFADAQACERDDEVGGLSGKRILCVGGRTNLIQHYRALVERHGGEFLHHDGGLEESLDSVTRAMSTVDAVLCPIDCVSHAATLKVKRACKHLAKEFVVLRSSGMSSFARGIRTIASPKVAACAREA